MSDRGELGSFLREVINWDWVKFCSAKKDPKYNSLHATVFSLIEIIASQQKIGAIKLAIARTDGNLETPVRFEFPKVYLVFPHAKTAVPSPKKPKQLPQPTTLKEAPQDDTDPVEIMTMGLRDTVKKMAIAPRQLVPLLLNKKKEIELDPKGVHENVPLVKSVIVACLLHMAIETNNFEAIQEVFDQIDGKLVETIKLLGDDIYIERYTEVAPEGSVKNKEGHWMIEDESMTALWAQKLALVYGK